MANKINKENLVKKRRVFYISGYDPRGSRFYHGIYKKEAQKQSKIIDGEFEIGPRKKISEKVESWQIKFSQNKTKTSTDYDFMQWDDIVRKSWIKAPYSIFAPAVSCYFHAFKSWKLSMVFRNSSGVFATFLYPLIAILLAFFAAYLPTKILYNWLSLEGYTLAPYIFTGSFLVIFHLCLKLMDKINIYWLLRMYIFFSQYSKKGNFDFTKRIQVFAKHITQEIKKNEADEYLIIGHSAGTMVLVLTVADILNYDPSIDLSKVKIVTLGHCIPILSYLKTAEKFHDNLKTISKSKLSWFDFGGPSDGICFAMTDPFINVCINDSVNLKLLSPRFHQMFDKKKYNRMKLNKFLIHFQYLMSSDIKTDYDYFEITSGNKDLLERFNDC